MSNMLDLKCATCGEQLDRVRYFPRQLLTADDMRVEQEYFREKARRHNRYLHGWGVVCGCAVEPVPDAKTWTVRVCPGYAVGPQGDEILIDDCRDVDLKLGATPEPCSVRWPCPPLGDMPKEGKDRMTTVYLAVRYAECLTRPTRVHPAGCGCDESSCEYSRIRDSYEIKLLWQLPDSHVSAAKDDQAWCDVVHNMPKAKLARSHTFPVPPCPECVLEPWVVLATVGFAGSLAVGDPNAPPIQISYTNRRTLLATQRLQTAMLCLP
jgi:hypothetical protein